MKDEDSLDSQIAEVNEAIQELKATDDKLGLNMAEEDLRYLENLKNEYT